MTKDEFVIELDKISVTPELASYVRGFAAGVHLYAYSKDTTGVKVVGSGETTLSSALQSLLEITKGVAEIKKGEEKVANAHSAI